MQFRSDGSLTVSLIAGPSEEKLRLAFSSLKNSLEAVKYNLVVSANPSTFDVLALTHEYFPDAKVVLIDGPLQFGKVQNQVLKNIDTEYVLMLTDEVECFPSTAKKLIACLERHKEAVLSAPALYVDREDQKPQLPGPSIVRGIPITVKLWADELSRTLFGNRFYRSHTALSDLKDHTLAYVENKVFLARTKPLWEADGYDETYDTYFSDIDLGHRLRHTGFHIYQAEEAKCIYQPHPKPSVNDFERISLQWQAYNQKFHSKWICIVSAWAQKLLLLVMRLKRIPRDPESLSEKEFTKILVYQKGSLTDFLMMEPALRALKERFPEAAITLLGNEVASEFFSSHPSVSEVRILPREIGGEWRDLFPLSRLKTVQSYLKELHLDHWDLFINFKELDYWADCFWPWLLSKYSKAAFVLGCDTDGRGLFLTHGTQDERENLRHMTRKYMDTLKFLGVSSEIYGINLDLSSEEDAFGAAWLEEKGITPQDFLVAIYAGGDSKSLTRTAWPQENFSLLIKQLRERHPVKILMLPGLEMEDVKWIQEIEKEVAGEVLILDSHLSIQQIASILKRCSFSIASDSLMLHVGLALKVPSLGIFGPTDYQRYASYGDEVDITALYRSVDCRPCVNLECENPICMTTITPETVLETASKAIQSLMKNG